MGTNAFEPRGSRTGRPGLVDPVRLDESGVLGPTTGQARGPRWRRTSQGFYVPTHVDGTVPEQRIVEAAAVLPAYGGVTGWAALRWMGGSWFDGTVDGHLLRPVWLVTAGDDVRSQPGICISAERLGREDLTAHDGLRVTTAVRSVIFEMRYAASLRDAVVIADMAMHADLVSTSELIAYAVTHRGWTGNPQCHEALGFVDENSWSPQEVRMRLCWQLEAGFPRPLCNVPVFDRAGRHVGTPDLLDPVAGVAGEYDGSMHLAGHQRARDLAREESFESVGLVYFTVVAANWAEPGVVPARMARARQRAKFLAPQRRDWTLEQPSWWVPTQTVAQRRALDDDQRRLWLRGRAG